jgi:hypothetical protein
MPRLIEIIVGVIILVKIIFVISLILEKYLKFNNDSKLQKYKLRVTKTKKITEYIFMALMSCLMIFVFYPRKNNINYMSHEIKILIYMFAWIVLISSTVDEIDDYYFLKK